MLGFGTDQSWLRGVDLNHRPLGYEPNELPDCSTPRTDNNNPPVCRQTCAWAGVMSRRLFKKTEGVGFPFQIEIFAFTKHTVGRVRRRTSTKQRGSADRIIYSIFPPPACAGKDPGGKPSQCPGWVLGCAPYVPNWHDRARAAR